MHNKFWKLFPTLTRPFPHLFCLLFRLCYTQISPIGKIFQNPASSKSPESFFMIAKSLALFPSIITRAYLHYPHCYSLEKEMATPSSVLAWRIPGTGEPGGLQSMGSHRVGHDWSDSAAAAAAAYCYCLIPLVKLIHPLVFMTLLALIFSLNTLHYLLFLYLSLKFVFFIFFSSVTFASHYILHHYMATSSRVNFPFFLLYYVSQMST